MGFWFYVKCFPSSGELTLNRHIVATRETDNEEEKTTTEVVETTVEGKKESTNVGARYGKGEEEHSEQGDGL